MSRSSLYSAARHTALLLSLACAAGAALAQTPAACPAKEAEVAMPSGVDNDRLRVLDQARPPKVYVDMLRFGDGPGDKAIFPPEMAARSEFSASGLTRMLADTILSTRRFQVYDSRASVVRDETDVVIDAKILEASLSFRPAEGGRRRAQVRVTMSVQMQRMPSGENLFPAAVKVEGVTGRVSGDGVVIGANDDENSPRVQRELMLDFNNALRRAYVEAAFRIGDLMRPMARVMSARGCDIGLFGGSRFGIQGGDELVVFRAEMDKLGDREVLASTQPVALMVCQGVGVDNAQCKVQVLAKGWQPQKGDYAVVTDKSMRAPRVE